MRLATNVDSACAATTPMRPPLAPPTVPTQDQRNEMPGPGAERGADADLVRPLGDGMRD